MASILITGGAGFIGSNTAEQLLRRGHRVRIYDNFFSGLRRNLEGLKGKVEVLRGDVRDLPRLKRSVRGADFVIHLAAVTSVIRSVKDPQLTLDVNVNGTLNVLLAAKEARVRRVVLASSSSVYGNAAKLPKTETAPPNPLSPYAASKAFLETLGRLFWQLYGLETVSLRYFNVFGPRQDPDSPYSAVIPIFIKALLHKKPLPIFGDGQQSRDFTFIENVCRANGAACLAPQKVCGEVFNIGGGERIPVLQLARQLSRIFGVALKVRHLPARPGEVRHSQADIRKAKKYLRTVPRVSFEEGLKQTAQWYCQ